MDNFIHSQMCTNLERRDFTDCFHFVAIREFSLSFFCVKQMSPSYAKYPCLNIRAENYWPYIQEWREYIFTNYAPCRSRRIMGRIS